MTCAGRVDRNKSSSEGQQPLRGLSAESWNAYLDSAGYPRESRLPVGYQFPTATTLKYNVSFRLVD